MNKFFVFATRTYDRICGVHPHRRIFHFQWLSVKDFYPDLRRLLAGLNGRVLDIGCRDKPYSSWMIRASQHVGADIAPGPCVDILIPADGPWELHDTFDAVLCTQVLQHIDNPSRIMREIDKVLSPGGVVVIAAPFCYRSMDSDVSGVLDRWRFSVSGLTSLLPSGYELIEAHGQGGIGSTVGQMTLNWLSDMAASNRTTNAAFVLAMPVWIVLCVVINTICALADVLDQTERYYHNVVLVARKKQ